MNVRTRVVIQSRLSSSRLPGKALMTIAGMPLIELVARRVSRSGHEVVVATSDEHYDGRIADHLSKVGVAVVRGALDDVLGRFVMATQDLADEDWVVRMTGDNPAADADLIDDLSAAMDAAGVIYGRNNVDLAPEGIGCEVFPVGLLRRAAREATEPYDREHVTPWIRRAVEEVDHVPTGAPNDIFRYRATVDCLDDFDVMTRAFDGIIDPVSAPWTEVLRRVGEIRTGPMVGRLETGLHSISAVAMQVGPGIAQSEVREMVRRAVACGVSHVVFAAAEAAAVRDAIDPAVRQRLRLGLVVGETDGDPLDKVISHARLDLGGAVLDLVIGTHPDELRESGVEVAQLLSGPEPRIVVDRETGPLSMVLVAPRSCQELVSAIATPSPVGS